MNIQSRNNVHVTGEGPRTLVLVHGFGFDQNAWRYLVEAFSAHYRLVLLDLTGSGESESAAYDPIRHANLHGHADDLLEVIDDVAHTPVIAIGHSVGANISMLATIKRPERFSGLVLVGPSPCLINHGDYHGGFERRDIDSFIEALENNFLGWSSTMAPAVLGAETHRKEDIRFAASLQRNDTDIAKHFARTTLLSDHRADLKKVSTPTLIVQSTDDPFVPLSVGKYMQHAINGSALAIIENTGHCPHISAPDACIEAINAFLNSLPAVTNGQSEEKVAVDHRGV
jgi:sigma-B regulation protein RsbQ